MVAGHVRSYWGRGLARSVTGTGPLWLELGHKNLGGCQSNWLAVSLLPRITLGQEPARDAVSLPLTFWTRVATISLGRLGARSGCEDAAPQNLKWGTDLGGPPACAKRNDAEAAGPPDLGARVATSRLCRSAADESTRNPIARDCFARLEFMASDVTVASHDGGTVEVRARVGNLGISAPLLADLLWRRGVGGPRSSHVSGAEWRGWTFEWVEYCSGRARRRYVACSRVGHLRMADFGWSNLKEAERNSEVAGASLLALSPAWPSTIRGRSCQCY
jgi:hypothetical protein